MSTERDVMARLDAAAVVEVDADELERLTGRARIVREVDTRLSGMIRVLDLDGELLLQEQTTRGVLLVRRLPDPEAADRLIEQRLAIYERMWDGCGCKVDYFKVE